MFAIKPLYVPTSVKETDSRHPRSGTLDLNRIDFNVSSLRSLELDLKGIDNVCKRDVTGGDIPIIGNENVIIS